MARCAFLAFVVLAACGGPLPSPSMHASPSTAAPPSARAATAAATASPAASEPAIAGIELPAAGRPWDAISLLDAMRTSTRPGGVPDVVESASWADALARSIWTVDGAAWDAAAIGGFCGPSSCTLDIAGSHDGRAGEDLWTLELDLASGAIRVLVADVRSLPGELVEALDRLARELAEPTTLDAMTLANARWLPPPAPDGRFVLSYRSGGEEGSCAREITVDAVRPEVIEAHATGC